MISLRNKVFKYMLLTTSLVSLVFVSITVILFYLEERKETIDELAKIAVAYSKLSQEDIVDYYNESQEFKQDSEQITIIDKNNKIIFDSDPETFKINKGMDVSDDAEIIKAISNTSGHDKGKGSATRISDTTRELTYFSAIRLDDGTIVRVSKSSEDVFNLVIRNPFVFTFMVLLEFLVCFFFAIVLTRTLLLPIEDSNSPRKYSELKIYTDQIDFEKSKVLKQEKEIVSKDITLQTIVNSNLREGFIIINEETNDVVMNKTASKILEFNNMTHIEFEEMFQSNKQADYLIESNDDKYSVHVNPLIMDGEEVGMIYFMVDVTENLKVESLRRNFTANVSHELKTPLSTILGYSELIENNMVSDEARTDFAKKIKQEVTQLVTLVEDILLLSNLDESSEHSFTQCNTKQIIERVVLSLEPKTTRKDITIKCDVDEFSYSLNYRLFYEIVHNLVLNSINYSSKSSEIKIVCKKIEGRLHLKVIDNGIGIPKAEQERIFERFYRVEKSRSRRTEGTGLGLAIVRNAVKHHKGEIYVSSELGEGTTFTVII